MIPKSGNRFSDKIMRKQTSSGWTNWAGPSNPKNQAQDPEKLVLGSIGDGYRFPAFAKPASAGEGRSDKIMRELSKRR
jgi:hypothetical protein